MKKLLLLSLTLMTFATSAFAGAGHIVSFNGPKGFGFIKPLSGGDDIFFFIYDVNALDRPQVSVGNCVTYNVQKKANSSKPQAMNVALSNFCD